MRMTKRVLAKAWLACAAVAAIIPAAAHAQALPAGTAASLSFSKSEAILGARYRVRLEAGPRDSRRIRLERGGAR